MSDPTATTKAVRRYEIVLPEAIALNLEAEARSRGLTPEEWFVRKVYAAGSQHTIVGDWEAAPQEQVTSPTKR